MAIHFTVLGIGESLFDVVAGQQRLGGAPLNVAVHAHQLLAGAGLGCGAVVSRVGQDALGQELVQQIAGLGMDTSLIQTDPDRPTGRVLVQTDAQGQPAYDIESDVAWDVIHFDPDLESAARQASAVAFGSLAQRDAESRNTIYRFLDAARRAVKCFDVNLRASGGVKFYNRAVLMRSCELATMVKLNDQELPEVLPLLGVDDLESLRKKFELEAVVLTRGALGTAVYTQEGLIQGKAVQVERDAQADSVGAGDACTAAVLAGRLAGLDWPQTLSLANAVAGFVVGQAGATPTLPKPLIEMLKV